MTIQTYADVTFPFDTEYADGRRKVRLLAAVVNDHATHIIGYTYDGDDPTISFSQVIDWDENGVFAGGRHPGMDLVPPPGVIESRIRTLNEEVAAIRQRLAENPNAPEAWRAGDESRLESLERQLAKLTAPHIWDRAA